MSDVVRGGSSPPPIADRNSKGSGPKAVDPPVQGGSLQESLLPTLDAIRTQVRHLMIARQVDTTLRPLPAAVRWQLSEAGVRLVLPQNHRVSLHDVEQRAQAIRDALGLEVRIDVLPGADWRAIPARVNHADREGRRVAQLRRDILELVPARWNPELELSGKVATLICRGHIVTADERRLLIEQIESRFGVLTQVRTEFCKGSAYRAIRENMPPGIQVWRAQVSQLSLADGTRDVIGLWCQAPAEKLAVFREWQESVERHTGAIIIPSFEAAPTRLRERLLALVPPGQERKIIADPERVLEAVRTFYGPRPVEDLAQIPAFPSDIPREKEDRHIITIDSALARTPRTNGSDRTELPAANIEDGLWARELPNGNVKVSVYIIDAAWRIRPGSPWAIHAERAKFSLFAGEHSVHMLGTSLSFHDLSLHEKQDRVVWRISFEVTPTGERTLTQIRRLVARAAANYSPDEVEAEVGAGTFPYLEEYRALQLSAQRLRGGSQRGSRSVAASDSAAVVEEHMIAAVQVVAEQLQARGVVAPFRIHGELSSQQRGRLVPRIRACGIPVTSADLQNPDRGILVAEQLLKHPQGSRLGHFLIASYLYRSQFHPMAGKHAGLRVDAYTQLKACRSYPALMVQWIMERTFDADRMGSEGGPVVFSAEQISGKMEAVNEYLRSQHQYRWELYRLAGIAEHLKEVGDLMTAEVVRVRGKDIRVRVRGTELEGSLRAEPYERAEIAVGQSIPVRLQHFHARRLEYVFSYESALMKAARSRAQRSDPSIGGV